MKTFGRIIILGIVLILVAAGSSLAAGTSAGLFINNQATLDYEVGGVNQPDILSDGDGNTANGPEFTTFVVDNRVDLTMAGGDNATASGTGQIISFTITNTGNETQGYALELFSGVNGTDDTINMDNVAIYYDANGNGIVDGGETPYVNASGNNVADVAPNSSIDILVVSDVPSGAITNDTARYTLVATTLNAGTTTVTTATAGADDPATVDVVLGDSAAVGAVSIAPVDAVENGQFNATATYTIQAAQLSISKAVAVVSDPFNGATDPKAIPGATVSYTIEITNSGVSAADNVVMTDPIPANTNFVVGSVTDSTGTGTITYDNGGNLFTFVPVADADGSDSDVTHVRVSIPTIAGGGGTATITFDVLIE